MLPQADEPSASHLQIEGVDVPGNGTYLCAAVEPQLARGEGPGGAVRPLRRDRGSHAVM